MHIFDVYHCVQYDGDTGFIIGTTPKAIKAQALYFVKKNKNEHG